MKRRNIITVVVFAVLFFGMVQIPQVTKAQAATEIKIGLLSPMTGGLGSLGPTFKAGADLAISELNSEQTAYNFVLEVQDTETDPTKAQAAATALVDAGVSGVVGGAASSVTLGAMPTLKAAEIPQISYASTSPALTTADDSDFLFRVVPSDAFQGKAAAQLADKIGLEKMAVIGIDDPYGQGLVGAFVSAFEALGGTVTKNIAYDQVSTVDFNSQVTDLIGSDPDGVFMVSFLTDGAAILNELNSQSFRGTILGTDGIASKGIFEEEGFNKEAAEGVQGTAPTITGTDAFVKAFEAANNDADPGIFVAEAYDATKLLGLSVIAAGSGKGADVRDALRNVAKTYSGASGSITFDANGDREGGTYDIWQFTNGTLNTIGSWSDDVLSGSFSTRSVAAAATDDAPLSFGAIFFGIAIAAIVLGRRRRH